MADISKIKVPGDTTTYNLKDSTAIASITINGNQLTYTTRSGTTSSPITLPAGTTVICSDTEPASPVTGTIWFKVES